MVSRNNIRVLFGLRLKELRAERGISQDVFAFSIGMSRSYYAEVEIGKRNISLDNIYKIASGFGITVAELFDSDVFRLNKAELKASSSDTTYTAIKS